MHGGVLYIRGNIEPHQIGKEVKIFDLTDEDKQTLKKYLEEYCQDFNLKTTDILKEKFIKLIPYTHRPYGKLYAY